MAQANNTSSASSGPATKVAVLDVNAAIVSTAEGKQASAELQSQFAPQQAEMDAKRKKIDDVAKQLSAGSNTLSDEGKAQLQGQIELLQRQLQNRQQEFQDETQAAQAEVVDRIGRKMLDVVDRYGRENNLAVVVNSSGQTMGILYKAPQLDITAEIIKLYDQQYPVKASAATPAAKPPAASAPKKPGGGPGR